MQISNINLKWLGHSGFLIAPLGVPTKSELGGKNSKTIYIDPYQIKDNLPKADLILLTHSHYDHCSLEDLNKIVKDGTKIIAPADCQSKITRFSVPIKMQIAEPNQEMAYTDVKILTLPAYNLDKHFHPKDEGWLGYLIKINDVLIYHAGDTDFIPEMQKLTGYSGNKKLVTLLPIGGRFTMTAEEAVEAAKLIKPHLVIPMHYGSIEGAEDNAEEFKQLCEENKINFEILEKE